jgi:phosphoribosylamine--glycine ligase / phosphoribosylformylglycinamidine cyclo-ligase
MSSVQRSDEPLRILLVGNGGREHALVWRLAQAPSVAAVFVAPGNAAQPVPLSFLSPNINRQTGNGGTAIVPKAKNIDIGVTDFAKLVQFAQDNNVHLVVPGPEVPLVDGIESWFRKGEHSLA